MILVTGGNAMLQQGMRATGVPTVSKNLILVTGGNAVPQQGMRAYRRSGSFNQTILVAIKM